MIPNEKDEKFLAAGQESIRLEIALERYFQLEESEMKETYRQYLQKRFRPAMEKLIGNRENARAREVFGLKEVTLFQVEDFIRMAQKAGNTECVIWLLRQKEERFGFAGKDMEL